MTRVSRVRSMRACGPSTGLTACALAGRRCSLWGWREGVPGGVPSTVVRGAWCQALSLPRPLVLRSVQPGFRDPRVPGAVGAGVWTQHRPHSALVLEYEGMFTGKRSKLSRSQRLCPGQIEVPEARRFLNILTPQIGRIGGLEGASVMSTSSPSIGR